MDYEVRVRTAWSEVKIHISVYTQVMEIMFTFSYFILRRVGRVLELNDQPFKLFYLKSNIFSWYKSLTC